MDQPVITTREWRMKDDPFCFNLRNHYLRSMSPGYQESESVRKIKLIKAINKIYQTQGKQLTPDDFDILWDVDFQELVRIRLRLREKYQLTHQEA